MIAKPGSSLRRGLSVRANSFILPMKIFLSGVHYFRIESFVEEACCSIASSNCTKVAAGLTCNSQLRNFQLIPFEVVVSATLPIVFPPRYKTCLWGHRVCSQTDHRVGEYVHVLA